MAFVCKDYCSYSRNSYSRSSCLPHSKMDIGLKIALIFFCLVERTVSSSPKPHFNPIQYQTADPSNDSLVDSSSFFP